MSALTLFLEEVVHAESLQVGYEGPRVVGRTARVHRGGAQGEVQTLAVRVVLVLVQRVEQRERVLASRQTD